MPRKIITPRTAHKGKDGEPILFDFGTSGSIVVFPQAYEDGTSKGPLLSYTSWQEGPLAPPAEIYTAVDESLATLRALAKTLEL